MAKTYTTGEAAAASGLSQNTIIRCFDLGALKGFKIPGSKCRRIPRVNLLTFMLEHNIPLDGLGELSGEERVIVDGFSKRAG